MASLSLPARRRAWDGGPRCPCACACVQASSKPMPCARARACPYVHAMQTWSHHALPWRKRGGAKTTTLAKCLHACMRAQPASPTKLEHELPPIACAHAPAQACMHACMRADAPPTHPPVHPHHAQLVGQVGHNLVVHLGGGHGCCCWGGRRGRCPQPSSNVMNFSGACWGLAESLAHPSRPSGRR